MGSFKLRMHQNPFSAWGSLRRSPDPLVGWGGGYPIPIPLRLDLAAILPSSKRYLRQCGWQTCWRNELLFSAVCCCLRRKISLSRCSDTIIQSAANIFADVASCAVTASAKRFSNSSTIALSETKHDKVTCLGSQQITIYCLWNVLIKDAIYWLDISIEKPTQYYWPKTETTPKSQISALVACTRIYQWCFCSCRQYHRK